MKFSLYILLVCIGFSAFAQDGDMEGIDAYFMEPGYYDDFDLAKQNPDSVLYLDLSLQSPKLKEIPLIVFSFKNLKYLELAYNQIGSVSDKIAQLKNLEVLSLNGNKYLTSVSAKIGDLETLQILQLTDTGLKSAQIDELRHLLPDHVQIQR
jgi:Leucine-rich repeat (LRR) protein